MPSREFMKEVLESDSAKYARGEGPASEEEAPEEAVTEEEAEVEEAEAPAEDEEAEQDEEEEGEAPEGDEALVEEPPEDDQPEADEEPSAEEHEDFYLEVSGARYRTREEAERGVEETRRAFYERSQEAAETKKERDDLLQRLAYYEGLNAGRGVGGQQDFDEWADGYIEQNPEQGMLQAIQFSREADDQSYAYAYTDRWAQQDPYQASVWRNRLETAIFQAKPAAEAAEDGGADASQTVINDTWSTLAEQYPDMREDNVVRGMSETIRSDPDLRAAALTGDPNQVRLAFLAARRLVQSTQNTPRRIRKSDAEQVAREKREATVSTGDGAPQRRSSSPVLSAEEESILAGAEKLGLKRRDQE